MLLESELKQYIDKVFDLREMICTLETQVQEKGINEFALEEELKVSLFSNKKVLVNKAIKNQNKTEANYNFFPSAFEGVHKYPNTIKRHVTTRG